LPGLLDGGDDSLSRQPYSLFSRNIMSSPNYLERLSAFG
jgi:hypothetical protein